MDSLTSDLGRIAISNKDTNIEPVRVKKPAAKPRKAAKVAETAGNSEVVPKRKIMIDLKRLAERANGARKPENVVLAPSPMFTAPVEDNKISTEGAKESTETTSTAPVEQLVKGENTQLPELNTPITQAADPMETIPSILADTTTSTPTAIAAPTNTPIPTNHHLAQVQAASIPLPASAPPTPQPQTDKFISYKPDGPAPESIAPVEPLKWLAPNTATPSPVKKRELPVFTSTGAIPFGVPVPKLDQADNQMEGEVEKGVKKEGDGGDIWEVPESPFPR